MNAIRIWYWKFLHGALMDRCAMLDQLAHEAFTESEECMREACQLRRKINLAIRRQELGLREPVKGAM